MNVYQVTTDLSGQPDAYIDLGYDAWVLEKDQPGLYEASFGYWPSINDQYLPIHVSYHGDDYIEYETPIYLNGQQATLVSGWLYDEERYIIVGARPFITDTTGIVDRNTIDIKEGDTIEILYDVYSLTRDEWMFQPLYIFTVGPNNFELQDTPFHSGQYGIQFVIEDYNGDNTFTDIVEFNY